MFIWWQTHEGFQLTVYSVIEATQFLLQEGVEFVLTERFCQDSLEEYFGHQRKLVFDFRVCFYPLPLQQINKYKADIDQLGQQFEQQTKDFEEEKRRLVAEERAKCGRETSVMRSKLKSVTQQLILMKNTLDNIKREHQDLRINCLKLGTRIKPAIREVIKQVGFTSCSSHVSRH